MEVEFFCTTGFADSKISEVFNITDEYGLSESEWKALSDNEKYKLAMDWACNSGFEIWWQEV